MPYYPEGLQNVAIYLRKSREDIQAEREARERGESYDTLARHRRELLEIAHRYNYSIADIFEEVRSGERIDGRPEMMRLLENINKGMYSAVLAIDTSRLSRGGQKDQGEIIEAFQISETMLVTSYEGLIDLESEEGETNLEMRGFVNRQVLRYTKKNLYAGRVRSIKEGRYVFSRPPYGYEVQPKTLRLIPNENIKIVKMIKEWYLDEERSLGAGAIAKKLNEMGLPSPSSSIWTHASVLAILKNVHYTGYLVIGKKNRRKYFDHDSGRQREKCKRVSEDKWNVSRHQSHEPVWTWEERELILAKLAHGVPRVQQSYELQNPMAGLLKCGHCGRAMRRKVIGDLPAHIHCVCKKSATALLHQVEERLLRELSYWLENYAVAVEELQTCLYENNETDDVVAVKSIIHDKQQRISQLEKQNKRTHELLELGEYDIETYRERKKSILEEISRLQEEIDVAEFELRKINQIKEARQEIIPTVVKVLETYHRGDIGQKNRLLKQILDGIVYTKERKKDIQLTLYIKVPDLK